jgi:hypothetical protein
MQQLKQPSRSPDGTPRDTQPEGEVPHALLLSGAVALYLAALWLGIVVIRDTTQRSAVMAGIIVAIAAVGYIFTHSGERSDR